MSRSTKHSIEDNYAPKNVHLSFTPTPDETARAYVYRGGAAITIADPKGVRYSDEEGIHQQVLHRDDGQFKVANIPSGFLQMNVSRKMEKKGRTLDTFASFSKGEQTARDVMENGLESPGGDGGNGSPPQQPYYADNSDVESTSPINRETR
jgi:hypothetical protein